MKIQILSRLATLAVPCLVALCLSSSSASGQTVTSATRISSDARTPIDEIPFVIDQPGSYYVRGNLQLLVVGAGITINVSHVTIDLNGFALDGLGYSVKAIYAPSAIEDVTVKNGAVHGWKGGVSLENVTGAQVFGVRASDTNYVTRAGIGVGDHGSIRDCVSTGAWYGFGAGVGARIVDCVAGSCYIGFKSADGASISGCTSSGNSEHGFQIRTNSTVTDCTATGNDDQGFLIEGSGLVSRCTAHDNQHGFWAYDSASNLNGAVTFENCLATENRSSGIRLSYEGTIRGCRAVDNGFAGILTHGSSQVVGNCSLRNGDAGIYTTGSESLFEDNTISFNGGAAFYVSGNYNFIVRNRASVNVGSFINDTGTGNRVGALSTTPMGAGPWDNFTF